MSELEVTSDLQCWNWEGWEVLFSLYLPMNNFCFPRTGSQA